MVAMPLIPRLLQGLPPALPRDPGLEGSGGHQETDGEMDEDRVEPAQKDREIAQARRSWTTRPWTSVSL